MQREPVSQGLRQVLDVILDDAMRVGGACCGSLQIYDPRRDTLDLVACHGMPPDVVESFRRVPASENTVCARAWRNGCRLSVPLLAHDPLFAPYLQQAQRSGFRSCTSTPIVGARGPLGVMSTHFADPFYPSSLEVVVLDECMTRAARAIELATQAA